MQIETWDDNQGNQLEYITVPAGKNAYSVIKDLGLPLSGDTAIVVIQKLNGELKDLTWCPDSETKVKPIASNTDLGRSVIRHSTAHILAQAVQQFYPEVKFGIGPPIKDGFYYDFDLPEPLTPETIVKLEKAMHKIIKSRQIFRRRVFNSVTEAETELRNQPYKLELITEKSNYTPSENLDLHPAAVEVGVGELTVYDNLDCRTKRVIWSDLCRGPHVLDTKYLGNFKLTKFSAAYWKGDQKNNSLQRIYGTAWESKDALAQYLQIQAEAKSRDHRKLGKVLDLFSFPDELGSGLVVFHPKGGMIKNEMEQYSLKRHLAAGYQLVSTPHVAKQVLFEVSGHLSWYKNDMFPSMILDEEVDVDGKLKKQGQQYYLKPMNCPMHILIYKSKNRSYRELPLRLFEFGTVYRYEKSGVVHGLTRIRGFTQDDAHIFCTESNMRDELTGLLQFILNLLDDFGLNNYYLELSTKNEAKYFGTDSIWEQATDILTQVALDSGLNLILDKGGAAFYGPKISVQVLDALGRNWQISTIQLDYLLPARFNLEFTDSQGNKSRPIMIHRALFGSIERFLGILIEHYAGAFPVWLAPIQVIGIPITQDNVSYLKQIITQLQSIGIRAELDDSDDRMQKKIRNHTTLKTPFMLIAGNRDQEQQTVSFRFRDGSQTNSIEIPTAINLIKKWINSYNNASPTAENFLVLNER